MNAMEPQILNLNRKLTVFGIPIAVNKLHCFSQRQGETNHLHSYIELYYSTEGSFALKLDYSATVTVDKNQWVLLDRNQIHEEVVYGRCSGFNLGIEVAPDQISTLFPGLVRDGFCTAQNGESVGRLLDRIRRENTERPPGYADYSDHLLSMLMIELCRVGKNQSFPKAAREGESGYPDSALYVIDTFFNRVFRYENEGLTIDRLAEKLHMSTRNVNRILLKHYGMTFHQMLLSTRMRFTEYLLLQSERSVSEICEICDLSEAYLIRCFKQIYGMTPAQFRKEHKQKSE